MESSGTPRPQEILRELLGLDEEQAAAVRIVRVSWLVEEGAELPGEAAAFRAQGPSARRAL
jgi:hypothetical protein